MQLILLAIMALATTQKEHEGIKYSRTTRSPHDNIFSKSNCQLKCEISNQKKQKLASSLKDALCLVEAAIHDVL